MGKTARAMNVSRHMHPRFADVLGIETGARDNSSRKDPLAKVESNLET